MKKLIDLIQEELVKAFTAAEMDPSYARVSRFQPPGSVRIPVQRRNGSCKSIPQSTDPAG